MLVPTTPHPMLYLTHLSHLLALSLHQIPADSIIREVGPFVGGIAALVVAGASGWIANRVAVARFEGIVMERFNGQQRQIDDIKVEQKDQWGRINDTAEAIAALRRRTT